MAARRELHERIENEANAHGSDLGSQNQVPMWPKFATAVRSLDSQYVFISFYCAIIALPLYVSWACLRSSHVHTALPVRLWRPMCCSDAYNKFTLHACYPLPLDLLVLSLLKEEPRFCA